MPAARAMALRRPEAPTPCGLPFKHSQIWEPFLHHFAPFLAVSQYGFVVYQPLTTTNCTSGASLSVSPPWTLDFGLWTLDFGLWTLDFAPELETRNPELLRASAAIRTYPGLSVIFDFFGRAAGVPNQTGSRQIKVNQGH